MRGRVAASGQVAHGILGRRLQDPGWRPADRELARFWGRPASRWLMRSLGGGQGIASIWVVIALYCFHLGGYCFHLGGYCLVIASI